MKILSKNLVLVMLAITTLPTIICVVNAFEWRSADFADIALTNISSQTDVRTGSAMLILDFNGVNDGQALITADNTTASQLHSTTDTLVTEYMLTFDGDGTSSSGGTSMTDYVSYDSFLSGGLHIQRAGSDTTVEVTLHVKARNRPDEVSDTGDYTATQTITVTWDGL
jgi:hypothetical protein